AFNLNTAQSPSHIYSYLVDAGRLIRWTHGEPQGLGFGPVAEPDLVHYPSFDGRDIPAFVYRPGPKFPGRRPVLIDLHGGPEAQFRPGFLGRDNFFLNELGIALIFPNVRGSAGYGLSYLRLDNGRRREDAAKDVGALLDWIGRQPDLDASRVAVRGGSYGG